MGKIGDGILRAEEFRHIEKKINIIYIGIQVIIVFYYAMLLVNKIQVKTWGIIIPGLILILDMIYLKINFENCKILFWILSVLKLIAYSYIFINEQNLNIVLLSFPILILLIIQINIRFDFADPYLRAIIMIIITIPAFIFVLIRIFTEKEHLTLLGIICSLTALVFFVFMITGIISDMVQANENKVFEQQRFAEKTRQANEILKQEQQKVKKANELLGIQKIKLESANSEIKRMNSEMILQYEILKYIASFLEVKELMGMITNAVYDGMVLEFCAVIIKEGVAENDTPIVYLNARNSKKNMCELSNKISFKQLEIYCKDKKEFIDNRVKKEKYPFLSGVNVGSLMIIPIIKERRLLGSFVFGHERYGYFNENKNFFETITAQFSIALNNAQLYAKMQQMAICDGLTGIYNRGYLNRVFEEFCKEAEEKKGNLSVALFDIDHFKQVNDTYGHLFGDLVIKTVANHAKKSASKNGGFAARYGGEEFVVVFPNKSLMETYEIVEELRQTIRKTKLEYEGIYVDVYVSVGVTSYPETTNSPTELLNNADWAMYYSKQNGRDRITIDSEAIRKQVKGIGMA